MRLVEQDILSIHKNLPDGEFSTIVSDLHQQIETSSLSAEEKAAAIEELTQYEQLANQIYTLNLQIQEIDLQLDSFDLSVDPILIELMVSIDAEVRMAQEHIEQTRKNAITASVLTIILGLIIAIGVGILLHRIITHNILLINQAATQFQAGNMQVRTEVHSNDELGQLADTFNDMAREVETLTSELREQAVRDSLTGLFNRRYLDETLPRELSKAKREGFPITILMMDIDDFKNINDEYGHAVGDQFLIELGEILLTQSRKEDILCRFGGDEIMVLLPGANLSEGMRRAETWRKEFHKVAIPSDSNLVISTLSIGVVQWNPGESTSDFLKRVDTALYKAKTTGRNRTISSPNTL